MWEKENEIIFLGTGTSQGVPSIGCDHPVCLSTNPKDKRLRSSVFVKTQGKQILIDCGPDFRQQMLRENLDDLDAILITHEHNDHIIGLDDMRPILFRKKKEPLIFSISRVLDAIRTRFPYAFIDHKYPGVPTFNLKQITPNQPFQAEGLEIIPLKVWHGKLDIVGYRIGNMAYITDVKTIPTETLALLKNLDVLIIDALRQHHEHHAHLLLEDAITYAQRIKAKYTYFTHMSHEIGFHDEVESNLPANMYLAYDGLRLKFS